jgi:hypothetical protein
VRIEGDNLIRTCLVVACGVLERLNTDSRLTKAELVHLRRHMDSLVAVLGPLEEQYHAMILHDAFLAKVLTKETNHTARNEASDQSKYRRKYRKLLRKFLATRTTLSREEVDSYFTAMDPEFSRPHTD